MALVRRSTLNDAMDRAHRRARDTERKRVHALRRRGYEHRLLGDASKRARHARMLDDRATSELMFADLGESIEVRLVACERALVLRDSANDHWFMALARFLHVYLSP